MNRKMFFGLALGLLMLFGLMPLFSFPVKAATTTVFSETFEGSLTTWTTDDLDDVDNADYWGLTNYRAHSGLQSAWCAQVGDNSDLHTCDTFMDAVMIRPVSLRGYVSATLSYYYWLSTASSMEHLRVMFYRPEIGWSYASTVSGNSYGWVYASVSIPTTATGVGFNFDSYYLDTGEGAYVDNVVLTAVSTTPTPPLTVTSPNGGESWARGSAYSITWTSSDSVGANVKIELLQNGVSVGTMTSSTPNDGSYSWSIWSGRALGTGFKVRISSTSTAASDVSDANFAIVSTTSPSITVTSPRPGDIWALGTTHTITWSSSGAVGAFVNIHFTYVGWVSGTFLAMMMPNTGSFSWAIPSDHMNGDFILIVGNTIAHGGSMVTIASGTTCTLTVTNPNSASVWPPGSTQSITWTSSGDCGSNVKIELLKGGAVVGTMTSSTPNDGSYSWPIWSGRAPGTNYAVRVSSTSKPCSDTSDTFTLGTGSPSTSTITVTSPNGGESWARGSTHLVTWTWTGSPGANVKIELLKGGVWVGTAVASTPNDGSFSWTISSSRAPGTDYKIRVSSTTTAASDTSNNNFNIT